MRRWMIGLILWVTPVIHADYIRFFATLKDWHYDSLLWDLEFKCLPDTLRIFTDDRKGLEKAGAWILGEGRTSVCDGMITPAQYVDIDPSCILFIYIYRRFGMGILYTSEDIINRCTP